ncbi:CREB-regulated transcription coactivator [Carabus blaptoides fortunei]
MANPRKFSEKIALHNQKQAEETAKFEQIMREVSDVKPEQDANTLLGLSIMGAREDQPPQVTYRESRNRSMGVGPMRPRAIERRIDTSPYSGPYLSPPPDTSWRRTNSDSALHQSAMQGMGNDGGGSRWNVSATEQNDGRPRSSCDVPRVPGINIYPSAQEPGIVQIPIGNNTGSLPDLTSVHFPSPLHTPIDQDGDPSSSPYSSSPISASPATLSPTSVPTGMRSPQGQTPFQFTNRPMSQHHNTNHLSVPMNARFLHHNKGVTLENSIAGLVDGINYTQTNLQQPGYRSPLARPSPQSSPGVSGRHSAPTSPAAPSPIPDYLQHFDVQATMLQQTFKEFSMMDSPTVQGGINYMDQTSNVQTLPDVTSLVNCTSDMNTTDPNIYYTTSTSTIGYPTVPTSLHTTPNTPTSIPDIIFSDYSNAPDDLNRQDSLDEDLFPSDESLREGLGSLDPLSIQMLSHPELNVISDSAEDYFRLDRL